MANINYEYEIYDFMKAGTFPIFNLTGDILYNHYTLMIGLARTEHGKQLLVPFIQNRANQFINAYEEATEAEATHIKEYLMEDDAPWIEKDRVKNANRADRITFTYRGVRQQAPPVFYYMRDDEELGYKLVPFVYVDGRVRDVSKYDYSYTAVVHNTSMLLG